MPVAVQRLSGNHINDAARLRSAQIMDMLVKLYELSSSGSLSAPERNPEVEIRGAMAYEKHPVVDWIESHFSRAWAGECEVAFGHCPVSCWIAVQQGMIVGFCCYDVTFRGFLGPIGVAARVHRRGIGSVLLHTVLGAMRAEGYAYAVIGDAGVPEFFAKVAGATPIPDSTPGSYPTPLRQTRQRDATRHQDRDRDAQGLPR